MAQRYRTGANSLFTGAPLHGVLVGRRRMVMGGVALGGLLATGIGHGAIADSAPDVTPTGPILLRIEGAIAHTNMPGALVFDDAMLASLPQHSITTSTIWTEGMPTFTGPSVADVLTMAGALHDTIEAVAANNYSVRFSRAGLTSDVPIIARLIDGEPFSLREKGPLWIIFPYDSDEKFQTEETYSQSIWQLVAFKVR